MIFAGLDEETAPRLIFDDKRPVLQSGGIDSFLMSVPRHLGPLNHIRYTHHILVKKILFYMLGLRKIHKIVITIIQKIPTLN